MKKLLFIFLIVGVLIMLRPINAIIKDSVGNIIHRGFVVTGEVAKDNGDGSYDVYIAGEAKAYPKVYTLARNPDLAVGDTVRILYKGGCKELPIILPPVKPTITGEWVSPTGHIPVSLWYNEERAYDEDTESFAAYNVQKRKWSEFIQLNHSAMLCSKVRFWANMIVGRVDVVDIDAYYDGAWNHVYEGGYAHLDWTEKSLASAKTITAFRFRFYNPSYTENIFVFLCEVDFFEVKE